MSRTLSAISRHRLPVVGIAGFVAVALLLTMLVAGTLAGGAGRGHSYHALFHDASGLRSGDDVRIAGVRVGRVEEVALDGAVARVTFSVSHDQQVYAGTTATIDFLNLLGQRYVDLDAGAAGEPREPGSTIPLSLTEEGLDLTALFNAFRPLFEMIRPADVNELATNIVQVLQGEGPTIQHLTAETARLTRHLADRDEVIGAVIRNLTLVMETMDDHRTEFRSMIRELNGLTGAIADNRAAIGATIDGLQGLVTEFGSLLRDGGDDVDRAVDALAAWTHSFAATAPRLAASLRATQGLLSGYVRSLGLGSYLNTYVCESKVKVGAGPTTDLSTSGERSRRCR